MWSFKVSGAINNFLFVYVQQTLQEFLVFLSRELPDNLTTHTAISLAPGFI